MERPKPPNPAKSNRVERPTIQSCLTGHAGPVRAVGMKFAARLMEDAAKYITDLEAYVAYLHGEMVKQSDFYESPTTETP